MDYIVVDSYKHKTYVVKFKELYDLTKTRLEKSKDLVLKKCNCNLDDKVKLLFKAYYYDNTFRGVYSDINEFFKATNETIIDNYDTIVKFYVLDLKHGYKKFIGKYNYESMFYSYYAWAYSKLRKV